MTKYLHDNEKNIVWNTYFGSSISNAHTAALKNKVVNKCTYRKSPREQCWGSLNHWLSGQFQFISLLSRSSLWQRGKSGSSIFWQNSVHFKLLIIKFLMFYEFYLVLSTKHSPWVAEIYSGEKTLNRDRKQCKQWLGNCFGFQTLNTLTKVAKVFIGIQRMESVKDLNEGKGSDNESEKEQVYEQWGGCSWEVLDGICIISRARRRAKWRCTAKCRKKGNKHRDARKWIWI